MAVIPFANQVLNRFANVRSMISRGSTLERCLLGIHDPMPVAFPHGAMIPAFVSIWDQLFTEYRRPVLLWADRMQVPIHKSLAPRRNLMDRKDSQSVTHIRRRD